MAQQRTRGTPSQQKKLDSASSGSRTGVAGGAAGYQVTVARCWATRIGCLCASLLSAQSLDPDLYNLFIFPKTTNFTTNKSYFYKELHI